MNSNYPHDIVPEDEIPKDLRDLFVPLSNKEAERLKIAEAEQRAKYLEGRVRSLEEALAEGNPPDKPRGET